MTSKQYKVALVGCGTIAPNHLNAISMLENVSVVALCDKRIERAEALKEKYAPCAAVYSDYEAMLDGSQPDSVHIATPHYLHFPMAKAALERGINVFLEKPICISNEEVSKLIEIEKSSKGQLCVCFQNRFLRAVQDAKKIVAEDGGVESAYCTVIWKRDRNYYLSSDWRGKYSTEGGGVMINQAIHTIDLLTVFLGKPMSVCATKANHHLKDIIEVEDTCEGVISFEGGKIANFFATTASHGTDDTVIVLNTKNHRIELRLPDITVDGVTSNYSDDIHIIGKKCYGNGHEQIIARYYNALAIGEAMPVNSECAQYALKILLAAYKSNDAEIII